MTEMFFPNMKPDVFSPEAVVLLAKVKAGDAWFPLSCLLGSTWISSNQWEAGQTVHDICLMEREINKWKNMYCYPISESTSFSTKYRELIIPCYFITFCITHEKHVDHRKTRKIQISRKKK